MSDEDKKSKGEQLREELGNLKAALQSAAGGVDERVQEVISRMEDILQPTS